jgi:hypothetical protein
MKPARWRWRKRPPPSVSTASSWTTAGSASARTTTPASATGTSIKENFPRPQAAHRQGSLAGHGLWPVGRAGDGQPRLRSLSQASRLGAEFPRPPALRAAQPTGAQPRAPDVRAYVLGFLDKLLTENDIAFLKWDYNRNWSEPGWDQLPRRGAEARLRRVHRNLYGILAELRKKHPNVEIESCSGGGGRVDLGILRYTDEVWPSDNTDPFDRLTSRTDSPTPTRRRS